MIQELGTSSAEVEIATFSPLHGWRSVMHPVVTNLDMLTPTFSGYVYYKDFLYKNSPGLFVQCYNTNKWIVGKSPTHSRHKKVLIQTPEGPRWGLYDEVFNVKSGDTIYSSYKYAKRKRVALDDSGTNKNFPYKLNTYGDRLYRTGLQFDDLKLRPKNSILQLGILLDDLSIGYELEIIKKTNLNVSQYPGYGLIPLRDGSLPRSGMEFASLPMYNTTHIQAVFDGIKQLRKEAFVTTECAFHVHFGNFPKTKEFIVSLYILYQRLQDEILGIMPHYLQNPVRIADKAKNYAEVLPRLSIMREGMVEGAVEKAFDCIFDLFVGTDRESKDFGKTISDPWGSNSWNSATRYMQLNFVNALLKEEGTLEFRVHPPTTNPQRVYFWTAICAAIIAYARRHTGKILNSFVQREKILLIDVVTELPAIDPELAPLSTILQEYINYLTDLRIQQSIEASTYGNTHGGVRAKFQHYYKSATTELDEDTKYTFDIEYEI